MKTAHWPSSPARYVRLDFISAWDTSPAYTVRFEDAGWNPAADAARKQINPPAPEDQCAAYDPDGRIWQGGPGFVKGEDFHWTVDHNVAALAVSQTAYLLDDAGTVYGINKKGAGTYVLRSGIEDIFIDEQGRLCAVQKASTGTVHANQCEFITE
jgi:hypothetical protein